MAETPTIAALATAPAPAGIAVIRMSGPQTKNVLRALFRASHDLVLDPRRLVFGELIDHKTGEAIDKALAVYMPGPHSYTGEDVGEFQFHGSPRLVEKMLNSLFAFGITPAEPGEFTKRAFLNGKLDLIQAESVADLITASTDQALRLANEQLIGRFSKAVDEIGEPLRLVLAEIEASLDFPDEGIEPDEQEKMFGSITEARKKLAALLQTYSFGHIVKEGFRVLLCGRPNVGKSSILNMLLGTERAIVTEISGTTRDLIEEEAVLNGYRFIFCDSAGLTETTDKVEKIGIELARERISWADLVLFVVDASDSSKEYEILLDELRGKAKKIWMITNKIDLNPQAITTHFCDSKTCEQNFYLSALSGDGLEALTNALVEDVSNRLGGGIEASAVLTNERHKSCLVHADEALARIIAPGAKLPLEIMSAELRTCLTYLEELVGKTYTEDILGKIFSKFCIGK